MNVMPNSPQARDIAYHVHPQTNLKAQYACSRPDPI